MSKQNPVSNFTTESKDHKRKGHSPVRDRCIEFLKALPQHGYERDVPLEDAKRIFKKRLGIMDQNSLTKYFGKQPHRSFKKMQRIARYPSGTVSYKNIELCRDVPYEEGYLETLGLVDIEQRGRNWFLVVKDWVLVPELGLRVPQPNEEGDLSKDGIYISVSSSRKELCDGKTTGIGSTTITNNNNLLPEKYKLSLENRQPKVTLEEGGQP